MRELSVRTEALGFDGGTTEEIADAIRAFGSAGHTQVELLLWPPTLAALEALAPVLELEEGD